MGTVTCRVLAGGTALLVAVNVNKKNQGSRVKTAPRALEIPILKDSIGVPILNYVFSTDTPVILKIHCEMVTVWRGPGDGCTGLVLDRPALILQTAHSQLFADEL